MGVEAVEEPKFFIELSKFDRPLFTNTGPRLRALKTTISYCSQHQFLPKSGHSGHIMGEAKLSNIPPEKYFQVVWMLMFTLSLLLLVWQRLGYIRGYN
jgi:hypothetical protein